jgi:copper chaperone NosL
MYKNILFFVIVLLVSCKPAPREIDYGLDACHYCKMNIVDAKYAAELVTKKGKIYTYDAIECLVNNLDEHPENTVAYALIKDYGNPEEWIDATQAFFVVNKKIQSPMGGNIAGFLSAENAKIALSIPKDSLFNWQNIKSKDFVFNE